MGLEKHGKSKEEEWIKEEERKKIEELKKKREEEIKRKLNEELRQLHFMHCPKCGHKMEEVTLEDVKVDRCTTCEGIYFDKGELEELIMKKTEEKKNFFRKLLGF